MKRELRDLFREGSCPGLIASGSVAMVYQASLPDGRSVAVKVLRPGVKQRIELDFRALRLLAAGIAGGFQVCAIFPHQR